MRDNVKYPCRGCIYYNVCGESSRTQPCSGRETKSNKKNKGSGSHNR